MNCKRGLISIVMILLAACGELGDSSGSAEKGNPYETPGSVIVVYQGKEYPMVLRGDCGPASDGSFTSWGVTLDANGEPGPELPQLMVRSKDDWSVIDFYSGVDGRVVRIYREGRNKFGYLNGALRYQAVPVSCPLRRLQH